MLDLCLPDVPGLVVLARLRARGNNAPVLVLTAFGDLQSACAAGRLGAARFMSKPVFLDLGAALRGVIIPAVPGAAFAQTSQHQGDAYATVETLAIAALLDHLDGLTRSDAPAGGGRRGFRGRTTRGDARQALLAVLLRAVADAALPVPCFAACAQALRRTVIGAPTESPEVTAIFAENLIVNAFGHSTTDPRVIIAIDRVRTAVSAHRRVTEDEIAHDLGVHPSHVGRILKAETGLTFREWRSAVVMKAVVCYLTETSEQVSQIAYHQLGYEHPSQLDREFHAMFGFSPREFRRLWHTVATQR